MIWLRYSLHLKDVNDGDQLIVCGDDVIIQAAERNARDVVPLYYEMRKADSTQLTPEKLYLGMIAAYTGGNIGEVSNNISKIWNSKNPDLYIIKLLTAYNNFVIDYAKTLYKPEFPKEIKSRISSFTSRKLPYFFKYAKPTTTHNTEPINRSVVNRLEKIVVNKRFDFDVTRTGEFNYKNLLYDQNLRFKPSNDLHAAIIAKYKELVKLNKFLFNDIDGECGNYQKVYSDIREVLREFGEDQFITDILVSYLYGKANSSHKESLWGAYGDILVENIKSNLASDMFSCDKCGKRVMKPVGVQYNAQKYCEDCIGYTPIETKVIKCTDCGSEFTVDAKANNRARCDACTIVAKREFKRNWKRRNSKK